MGGKPSIPPMKRRKRKTGRAIFSGLDNACSSLCCSPKRVFEILLGNSSRVPGVCKTQLLKHGTTFHKCCRPTPSEGVGGVEVFLFCLLVIYCFGLVCFVVFVVLFFVVFVVLFFVVLLFCWFCLFVL